jgi:hypothetical protein
LVVEGRLPGDFRTFQKCLIEAGYSTANTCRAAAGKDSPAAKMARRRRHAVMASALTGDCLRRHRVPTAASRPHLAEERKAVRVQPAKFGVRLLVIGHGTVSLAAT